MPRCLGPGRQVFRHSSRQVLQDGRALLESRLHSLLLQLAPLKSHAINDASPNVHCYPSNWASLLDERWPDASEQQRVEATQALSPARTALEAIRRFNLHRSRSSRMPNIDVDPHRTNVHFLGVQRAECYAPYTAFRDLCDVLGRVKISLVGPLAARPSIEEEMIEGLDVEIYNALYQDCEVSPPDLAVALNAGFQECSGKFWLPAVQRLVVGKIPTVFTGYSREDVVAGFACLLAHGMRPEVHFAGRNPFGSLLGPVPDKGRFSIGADDEEPTAFVEEAASVANRLGRSRLDGIVSLPFKRRRLHLRSGGLPCRSRLFTKEPPLCNSYWVGFCGSHSI